MAYQQQNLQNNQYINGFPAAQNSPQHQQQLKAPAYQSVKPQQINYQNFQTSAIKPQQHQKVLTNGNGNGNSNGSALSSRTASPAMMAMNSSLSTPHLNQIPSSQLPPPINRPNMLSSGFNINSSQSSQFGAPVPSQINNNVHTLSTNGPASLSTPNISQQGNQMPLITNMQNLNVNDPQTRPNPVMMSNSVNNNNIQASNLKAPQNRFEAPRSTPSFAQPIQGQNFMPTIAKAAPGKRPLYPTNISQPVSAIQPQFNPNLQQPNYPNNQMAVQQTQASSQNMQYQNLHPHQTQSQQSQAQSVVHSGFNKLWGNETIDLMQQRHVLPTTKVQPPTIKLNHHFQEAINCNPDVFRCTLTKIPESDKLLQKSRLPLGILIHPYRDLSNLPVISCSTIVRCRVCRTYINPFVFFVDSKKWKCNLCYRVNELPEEFQYDPVSKTYGDPTRRPEIKSSTIEFIAPSEYMLRPPQPAVYLFLLDVSSLAQQSGYLEVACSTISEQLDNLPGDARTQVGFIAYNSAVHFYNIADGYNQPHEITVLDVEDVFLPCPDNLLINLKECRELINDLLLQLPKRFLNEHDTKSALGSALQAAFKLMSLTGGRVSVFQTCLPNHGPGALQSREDPNNRSSKEVAHLGPATDFYKRLALECSGQQVAVDLFVLNSQYSDLATLSGISKFSGGCMHHFPLFNSNRPQQVINFRKTLERYLIRKVGFESVMRVRCTRGLSIHTFHGNFFVRSTDLLSLPNVNPDAGFGMQLSYEESLADVKTVCFQAALLYTSSKGERRIRVHTMCLPVTESLSEVMYSADAQCIVGLLSKMAVDRSLTSSLTDARDAFINATVDIFSAFKIAQNLPQGTSGVIAPTNLALLPLYVLAMLKHVAFRTGTSTRLDDRVFAMCEMKTLPLDQLIRYIYPDFYLIDVLFIGEETESKHKIDPIRLQLSAERLDSRSMFLVDTGPHIFIYVGSNVSSLIIKGVFGKNSVNEIPDVCHELPKLDTPLSESLHEFIDSVNEEKPFAATVQIVRDSSTCRAQIIERLVDDRNENTLSYYEFLQHLRTQVK